MMVVVVQKKRHSDHKYVTPYVVLWRNTNARIPSQKHTQIRVYLRQIAARYVRSVPLVKNLENLVVAVAAGLGSRNVEMSVTQTSIIHGLKASMPVKVFGRYCRLTQCFKFVAVTLKIWPTYWIPTHHENLLIRSQISNVSTISPTREVLNVKIVFCVRNLCPCMLYWWSRTCNRNFMFLSLWK